MALNLLDNSSLLRPIPWRCCTVEKSVGMHTQNPKYAYINELHNKLNY